MSRREKSDLDSGGDLNQKLMSLLNELRRRGLEAEVMNYPEKKRSVDILVREKALIKLSEDVERVSKKEFNDLMAASVLFSTSTLIISDKIYGEKVMPGIVFEKHGVRVISSDTFLDYTSGRGVSIYEWKGSFYVRINSKALRELREKSNMRISEVAEMLKVSKKTVYEYEKGSMDPEIDRAEKLIEIFGEEIVGEIDLFSDTLYQIDREKVLERLLIRSSDEDPIARRINKAGLTAIRLWRTAPDIIGSYDDNRFTIVVERRGEENISKKLRETIKFSKYFKCRTYFIPSGSDLRDKDLEGGLKGDLEVLSPNSLERDLKSALRK
ncbi:MAG: helix-turn-helix domain-containing protein [Sulfolobales archaeon]